jgi:hypothetical protein
VPEFSPLFRPFITHATFSLNDRLLMIVNAVAWIYIVFPLAAGLYQPILEFLRKGRSLFQLSAWRI